MGNRLGIGDRPIDVASDDDVARSVLLVEDDPDLGEALGGLLAKFGWVVRLEPDGAKAMDALRAGYSPRVIVCDLMMPNMDGYRFRAAQLDDPAVARIPVVVITSDSRATAEQLRVNACLRKPFEVEALLAELARLAG
ncbi:MAG: response regulator [Deltaproteobacteria bacterium]|nr:response regulator [Deltaproteobacteria bacterium]